MPDPQYPSPPSHAPHERLTPHRPIAGPEAEARAFYERMKLRRTVRMFSDKPVSRETIEWCIRAAGTAPSGANKQPWRFVAVSDPDVKHRIRLAAEAEERAFYAERATERWLKDLAPLGTDASKPFLDIAPWLVVVFALKHDDDGGQVYYVNESVGIAVGLFLTACHHAGLATLTHTPSPMGFLRDVLKRPAHERAYVLIPVGHPTEDCVVPKIARKGLDDISAWV